MWRRTLASLCLAALAAAHTAGAARAPLGAREVKVFLVALDDGGKSGAKVGCNDSLVAVTREVSPTGAPLRAALEELLALPQKAGPRDSLHNALHGSKLRLGRVYVRRGDAVIHLSGLLTTGGVCDAPRVRGQLEATALQFPHVRRVKVYVNGRPLAAYLSEKN